jgi:hypothetical protein
MTKLPDHSIQLLRRRLTRDADRYIKATADQARARETLTESVRMAAKAGVRQVDILADIRGVWTREHVRQLNRPKPDANDLDRSEP